MDTRQFLTNVVPWNIGGFVSVHTHRPGGSFSGLLCRTVDDVLQAIQQFASSGLDVYFCLSCHNGKRSRETAIALSAVPFDIDVGPEEHKYHSIDEAVIGVLKFCKAAGLPNPSAIVSSGSGGLHVYWFSIKPLPVAEWQLYADRLKELAITHGLKFDHAVTGDAARVLRCPDTRNNKFKPPRPVAILPRYSLGTKHDFAQLFGIEKPQVAEAFRHIDPKKFGQGIEIHEADPLPFAPIAAGCPFFADAVATGGANHDQTLWHLAVFCTVFMEDGHAIAHAISEKHPDYTQAECEQMWDRVNTDHEKKKIGWPSCKAIYNAGSTFCTSCPHFDKGKSPLHLGHAALHAARETEELKLLGADQSEEAEKLMLPNGYVPDTTTKYICEVTVKHQKIGGVDHPIKQLVPLFLCRIWDPLPEMIDEDFAVSFMVSTDLGRSRRVTMRMVDWSEGRVYTSLLSKGVKLIGDKRVAMRFGISWMAKIHGKHRSTDYGGLGWRYEDGKISGFVYGGNFFGVDGVVASGGHTTNDNVLKWYRPIGKKEVWYAAAKILTDRKRVELNILLAIAFAAPLMAFTGSVFGVMLTIWGEPGTAKSSAQQVAAAVWGHPKQARESLTSTTKSVLSKLGQLKNLAVYWDDVQDELRQENLFQTMFVNSEGSEGGRLAADATAKERKDWQTVMVACCNASFVEYIKRKQPNTTAGLRRLLEIEFNRIENERGLISVHEADKILGELVHNYGNVGYDYAKLLATEHEAISAMVSAEIKAFEKHVMAAPAENFWTAMCGALIAAARLMRRMDIEVDPHEMTMFLREVFLKNREIRGSEHGEGGTQRHTENALVAFLMHYVRGGFCVWTDFAARKGGNKATQVVHCVREPEQGRQVYVHIVREEWKIRISKRELRVFLHKQMIESRQVMDGAAKFFGATSIRVALAAGTIHQVGQEDVLELPVSEDSPFYEMLNANGPPSAEK